MNNNRQYVVTLDGKSQIWSEDKYKKNEQKLKDTRPDAIVQEVGNDFGADEQVRPEGSYLITIGDKAQMWDGYKLNKNIGHLKQIYPDARIQTMGDTLYAARPAQPSQTKKESINQEPITNFGEAVAQGARQMGGGIINLLGEFLNSRSGSAEDAQKALEYMADGTAEQYASREYKREHAAIDGGMRKPIVGKKWTEEQEWYDQDTPDKKAMMLYEDALREAGGNYNKAVQILKERMEEESTGDRLMKKGQQILEENSRPVEGWGWWGSLIPQMIGNVAALGLAFLSKGKSAKLSKALMTASNIAGKASIAGMTASTAGMSMAEARNNGANNDEVWAVGLADAAIELITEKIPFDRYTSKIYSAVKKKLGGELADVITSPAGRQEFEQLLERANRELGGKLFSGRNVKDYLSDIAFEAGGEFIAEALQTITPMIYLEPEKYPELSAVLEAGWEGAKAGLVMGSVLGGASKYTEHVVHRDRRKNQGYVDVAVVELEEGNPVAVEVLGVDENSDMAQVIYNNEVIPVNKNAIGRKYRYSYAQFEAGMMEMMEDEAIDLNNVSEGQSKAATDRVDIAKTELEKALAGFSDETKASIMNAAANDENITVPENAFEAYRAYREAVKRDKAVQEAYLVKQEKEKSAIREKIRADVGDDFWRNGKAVTDENGAVVGMDAPTVETATLKDGRVVYITSDVNESGECTGITEDGQKIFVTRDMIPEGTKVYTLDEYINERYNAEKASQEQERMAQTTQERVDAVKAKANAKEPVNIGTEEVQVMAVPIQVNADGVIVQSETGVSQLTWDEAANAYKVGMPVQTDAELASSEAAEILQAESAFAGEQAQSAEQIGSAETATEVAMKEEQNAEPLPLNADGSVDETTLWNNNPERWAQWNDEQRQDGGANSVVAINAAVANLQAQIAEQQTAWQSMPVGKERNDAETAINEMNARLSSLLGLQQRYVMAAQQQAQATEQPASTEETPAAQAESKPHERSVESEVARLYGLGLSDDEVVANLDAKVAKAQKALDAQSKQAPKMGADENAYIAKKREHQQKMQELQQELDFATAASKAVNENLAQQSQAPEAPGTITMEKDPEPQNAVEFAARELGLKEGGIKLQRQSFLDHTGYDSSEMKKFFGLFKSKQDGGMTIEQAGEKLMEMDRENNTGFFDQNDPNAGMNAILDALGAVNTIGELRSYVARQRQAEAQREADAAYSAMMADYEETFGESMEETAHYNLMMADELLRGKSLSEDEFNELNSKFAEEQNQYETRIDQRETEPVPGAEDSGDLRTAESGIRGGSEEGDSVLQDEQSVRSTREGVPEGQNEPYGDSFNKQDADASVPSGESTKVTAVESSLDEDMPDFENVSDEDAKQWSKDFFSPLRHQMLERINAWRDRLGIKINVFERAEDVTNEEARNAIANRGKVYGWFDPATGEVCLYLPDHDSVAEVNKTIFHEVVAHKGLRGLLGKEGFDNLCRKIWSSLTPEAQNKYASYALNSARRKQYDEAMKNGRSFEFTEAEQLAAADEFIAEHAESRANKTTWNTIVDSVKEFLKKIFGRQTLTDQFYNQIDELLDSALQMYESMAGQTKELKGVVKDGQTYEGTIDANTGKFIDEDDLPEGNTLYRRADGSLVGMHNISEEKLRKVIKQGGSANPSTAVIDIDRQDFTSYGDISLVMPSSLVNAETGRNAGTFIADAWTPTYPQVERRFSDDELQRKFWRDISAIPKEMQHEVRMAFDSWLDLRNDSGLAYMFLQERGEAPEMVRVEAKFPQEIKDKVSAILGEGRTGLYELSAEEKQAMLDLYIQENFGGNREEFDKSIAERIQRIEDRLSTGKVPSFVEKRITMDLQWMKEHGYDYDNLSKFVSAIASDVRHAGEVNAPATTTRALDYIKENDLSAEFEKWKESLNDRYGIKEYLFGGFTPSGNARWLPNTVENASRLMNKQGLNGATGITASFNRFVATLAPKKKSLSDIRASKAMLVEDEQLVDAFRDKWSEVFFELGEKCQPDAKGYEDYGLARLTEAAQKKNPGAYLKKEYGVELSQEDLQKLSDMIKAIKTEFPARYFETKFQRPVYLNEFAAAVMPTTTSEDIKQAVSEAGLPIFEYDSSVEGSRKEATLKATEGEGIRFRTARTADEFDTTQQEAVKEKGLVNSGLWSALINVVDVPKHDFTGTGKTAIRKAEGWALQNIAKEHIYHEGLNDEFRYLIDKDAVSKFLSKSSTQASENLGVHLAALKMLPQIINNSIDVEIHPDYRKVDGSRSSENGVGRDDLLVHRMYGAISIDGKVYRTKTTIHEFRDKTNEAYDYKITEIELIISGPASGNALKSPTSVSAANILKGVEKSYDPGVKVLDVEYLKAVEAGDMETAQRMVNEAARLAGYNSNSDYQGSFAFNGAAPSGHAYYDTKEERIEAWENGSMEDDQTLGDYKDAGIDISNLGWSLTSPVAQRMGNEYTRESIKNLADAVNSDSRKIKVYRAVDADIKENSVRNGDWVTPSRAYAEYHIGLQDWKEGRIIEQEVDIDDIWWDGNDINEWGYNDGKGYVYKNTPNNRKLLTPITYDNNGNVIPLSQRFNPENQDIRFRVRGENESAEEFIQTEINRFQETYGTKTPMLIVDYSSKEAAARSLGMNPEDLLDENYQLIVEAAEDSDACFISDIDTIAIFAKESVTTSGKADNIFFHENAHAFVKENPQLLELGQWLFENSQTGIKKSTAEIVRAKYPKSQHVEEMLTGYTGLMLSLGRSRAVLESLPEELKSTWEEIVTRFNYNSEYEDTRRKSDTKRDADGGRNAATVQMRNSSDSELENKGGISWKQPAGLTAEERRVINEYFPGFYNPIEDARNDVDVNPTEAQKKAGNYKMGHLRLDGYNITIENSKGSVRRGTDSKGNAWENTLNNDYGYIRGTEGVDGDHIDVYLSDNPTEGNVFVIDQVNPETREFDEHKVMYGFGSAEEAREAYLANFSEGWNGLGTITEVSKDEFKKWIESSHRKTKPFSEYKSVNAIGAQSEVEEIDDGDIRFRITGTPTNEVVANGLRLSLQDFTDLAGNIYESLGSDMRKEVIDETFRNGMDMQKAVYDIPSRLVMLDDLTDTEVETAKMIAGKVEDAVLASGVEMNRPLTTAEALWMLDRSINPVKDMISAARQAVVADNLGFSERMQDIQKNDEGAVRFRRIDASQAQAAADIYNAGASNVGSRLYEVFVDQYHAVNQLVDAIEAKSGKPTESWEDVRMALNQMPAKSGARATRMTKKYVLPMWDAIKALSKKFGLSEYQIARYTRLKHGLERNELFPKRDAETFYRDMMNQHIANIRKDSSLSKAEKGKQIDKAEKAFQKHVAEIQNGTDAKYLELRGKDYSGIMAAYEGQYANLADAEAAARAEVASFERGKDAEVKALWDAINKLNKATIKLQYESGLMSKQTYNKLKNQFEYYVPLRGFEKDTAEDHYDYYDREFSAFEGTAIKAKGRKSEAESPFGHMGAMMASAIVASEKNLAKLSLYYFISNRADNGLVSIQDVWYEKTSAGWRIVMPPVKQESESLTDYGQRLDAWEQSMLALRAQGLAKKGRNELGLENVVHIDDSSTKEHYIKVRVNGQEKIMILNGNPRAAQAINGLLNVESDPYFEKFFGKLMRELSQLSTSYNPEFWMTNLMRDMATTFATVTLSEDKQYRKAFQKNYKKAWQVISLLPKLKNGTLGNSPIEVMLKEAVDAGLQTGYSHIKSNEMWDKDMEQHFADMDAGEIKKAIKAGFDNLQDISESMELVSRFAVFMTSRQMGRSIEESVADGKEVTANFNRKGSGKGITLEEVKKLTLDNGKTLREQFGEFGGKVAEAIIVAVSKIAPFGRKNILFFNASIQGIDKWVRLARKKEGNAGKLVAYFGGMIALGFIKSMLYGMLQDDDEYQEDISDYDRRNNFMIGGKGKYIKIPLPHDVRAFHGLGDILYNVVSGNYKHKDVWDIAGMITSQMTSLSPINLNEGWAAVVPAWAKPFVEAGLPFDLLGIEGTNKNFAGMPIRKETPWLTEDDLKRRPKYTVAGEYTWDWLVGLTKGINTILGGNDRKVALGGFFDFDPARIQHYIESYTGGVGRTTGNFLTFLTQVFGEDEWKAANTPFLNKVFTLTDERSQNKLSNDQFYSFVKDAEAARSDFQAFKKSGDTELASEVLGSDDYKIYRIYVNGGYKKAEDYYRKQLKITRTEAEEKEIKAKRDERRKLFLESLSDKGLI